METVPGITYNFKYIVVLALDNIDFRRLEAFVFAPTQNHVDVARAVGSEHHVVGAGFARLTKNAEGHISVYVHGESESLHISHSPLDLYYVELALGLHNNSPFASDTARRREDYRKGLEITSARARGSSTERA